MAGLAQSLSWHALAFLPSLVFRPVSLLLAVVIMWSLGATLTPVSVISAQAVTIVVVLAVQSMLLRRALRQHF